jgi:hypothetical protein
MKEREGASHHTHQPERAQPHEQPRYRVDHYGKSRNFAAYEGQTIIAVTLYCTSRTHSHKPLNLLLISLMDHIVLKNN